MKELWDKIRAILQTRNIELIAGFNDGAVGYDKDLNDLVIFAMRKHTGMGWAIDDVAVGKNQTIELQPSDELDDKIGRHIPAWKTEDMIPAVMQTVRWLLDEIPVYGIDVMAGTINEGEGAKFCVALSGPHNVAEEDDADADD